MSAVESDALERSYAVVGTRPNRPDGVDKVTGRARYGADAFAPGMLTGRVLRSPHPHARIRSIDTSRAEALAGVKAVVTRADFEDVSDDPLMHDTLANLMAGEKALYEGHGVAAVAAASPAIAKRALALIEVDYEVLPHVTDVDAAMQADAPVLHEDMFTAGMEPRPDKPSNVAGYYEVLLGDVEAGFAQADIVVEREFTTEATHQGYIEPHAVLANVGGDGRGEIWVCTQGHFDVRNMCSRMCGIDIANLRVTASEIGGGFGGKTTVFLEPVACALSRKSGHPVKMVMSREEGLSRFRSHLEQQHVGEDWGYQRRAHHRG